MKRTIRRLMLGMLAGWVVSGLAAAPALATTVTTTPASNRTTTTAVLHGLIDTGGVATAWEFQWGRTTKYNQATPLQQIPAAQGTVRVSWKLTHLVPNTTYHFRLVATTGVGTSSYPLNVTFGPDLTFTTKATGRLVLLRTRLLVVHDFVGVPLRCLSGLSCVGRLTISFRARLNKGKRLAPMLCATAFFNIDNHKSKTVNLKLRGGCLALLRRSPHRRHAAAVSSNPWTRQHGLTRTVVLALG